MRFGKTLILTKFCYNMGNASKFFFFPKRDWFKKKKKSITKFINSEVDLKTCYVALAHNQKNTTASAYKEELGRGRKRFQQSLRLIIHIQFHYMSLWIPLSYYIVKIWSLLYTYFSDYFRIYPSYEYIIVSSIHLTHWQNIVTCQVIFFLLPLQRLYIPPFIYPGIPLISHCIPWSVTLFGIFPNKINCVIQRDTDICILHICVFI